MSSSNSSTIDAESLQKFFVESGNYDKYTARIHKELEDSNFSRDVLELCKQEAERLIDANGKVDIKEVKEAVAAGVRQMVPTDLKRAMINEIGTVLDEKLKFA
uniref:Enhancer of yellow 2 transcription factor homolog n=1 Tax=Panagrellus redivivus TaxID=6233 RepID=A0A7E4UXI1_PANRE